MNFSHHLFSKRSFPSSILVSGIADDPSESEFGPFFGLILPVDALELGRNPEESLKTYVIIQWLQQNYSNL